MFLRTPHLCRLSPKLSIKTPRLVPKKPLPSFHRFDFNLNSHLTDGFVLKRLLKQVSPVTLGELIEFGSGGNNPWTKVLAAQFLHHELPVRLAKLVRDLKRLPYGLPEVQPVRNVVQLYEVLADIKERHSFVQQFIAEGIKQLKTYSEQTMDLSRFLDRFYMSRISIRMLIGQHLAFNTPLDGYIGIIEQDCSPARVAEESHPKAFSDAQRLCTDAYGASPRVELLGQTSLTLPYIPSHLYYILFELFKNSMRAVAEHHLPHSDDLPTIQCVVAEGAEDISIKISDRGGGIARSGVSKIWSYTYTTATHQPDPNAPTAVVPMAGFGYGLPLSRLHARYFGGDLQVISMEGFGTDAYVHLSKLGNVDEQLPG